MYNYIDISKLVSYWCYFMVFNIVLFATWIKNIFLLILISVNIKGIGKDRHGTLCRVLKWQSSVVNKTFLFCTMLKCLWKYMIFNFKMSLNCIYVPYFEV